MLNIYRASAGAGKTHHLTGEFLKFLFRKDYLPESATHETQFNEILAVTFTNKSTAEMKDRIIKELYKLSENPAYSPYFEALSTDGIGGNIDEDEVKRKAKKFLSDILNNYSEFAISTIDSFFQRIVRNFARELNMQSNYEVELKADRIIESAVSSFLEKIDAPKNKRHFAWLKKFSEKKMEDGAGWRLEKDLLKLVKSVLTSEDYRTRKDSLRLVIDDEDFLNRYTEKVKKIKNESFNEIKKWGTDGLTILREEGFSTTDFKGGSRSKMKVLEEWHNGEIKVLDEPHINFMESEEEWYAKPKKKSDIVKKLSRKGTENLLDIFQRATSKKGTELFIYYFSANAILENIYQLGILADIDKEVNDICNEEGTMLLSSATEFLNKLISVEDVPFIYEKIGTRIFSFMIDEFQDTSKMQWNNFKPLIENSLADGRGNLIVGDVKQSIYRWRGSDWGLLHNELKKFAPKQSKIDSETLDTNYRSQKQIVEFNNAFFKYISERLSQSFADENIKDIYYDVCQKIQEKKMGDSSGYVKVGFIEVSKDEKFENLAMEKLPYAIMELEDAGFQAKDIAILCRTKKICKQAADAILKFKSEGGYDEKYVFDIISSEALLLNSRQIILTILSILRYLQNPTSKILKAIASCNYIKQCGASENDAVERHFNCKHEIERFLEFSNRPLYDMIEGIISLLPNISQDIAFVQAFRDNVMEFANNKKSDISAFLDWWEINSENKCINTPEGQNAIQIMTIHKSKGLGMPAVILPCVEGTIDITPKQDDIIWCNPRKEPFKEENLYLPIKCSKSLTNTIFAEDFQEERLKAVIDNLNTIYVAFTRAKEAMIMFSPVPTDSKKEETQQLLLQDFFAEHGYVENDCILGELKRKEGYEKEAEKLAETISQYNKDFTTLRKIPRLSLKHDKIIKEIDAIEKGNCIHEALSVIKDSTDTDNQIDRLYKTGKLKETFISCEEMKTEIARLISLPEVRDWFKPKLQILNERTILSKTLLSDKKVKEQHRPDRIIIDKDKVIVVDYKTGEKRKSHHKQVREYMNFLSQMGFKNIEGYLWYIYPHEVIKVL